MPTRVGPETDRRILILAVPLPAAATDPAEFDLLEEWLRSYKPEELFHPDGARILDEKALRIIPKNHQFRLGQVKATYAGFTPLTSPDWKPFAHEKGTIVSNMKA